jgi:hypothetical protein
MTKLHISPTLALPLDFVTSTQAILAKKGKGKTYKAAVQAEELLDAHQQIVAIDPTGAWWGLRASADGKSAGYPVTIFGGEHADVPLETTAGEVIAEAIATEHFSAIIDLSLFRKGEALRFMAAFMETLYRKNRAALHLFIDEADVVAPQKTFSPEQARALGATDDLVRRGRIRGIGCTLITQRPQVLNKDVLSQIDMLTALGMNHPKDIGAIKDWVAVHGDEAQAKQMIADLPALPVGEAWVWAPAANIFKRVTFRDRRTFDSGRTPKAGEKVRAPKVLAPIDLARLGQTIAATVEQQKANDPKALKARVAELEKQLAAKPSAKTETKTVEKPVIKDAQLKQLGLLVEQGERVVSKMDSSLVSYADHFEKTYANAEGLFHRVSQAVEDLRKLAAGIVPPTNRQIAAAHFANDGKVTKLVGKHQIRVPAAIGAQQHPPVRKILGASASSTPLPIGEVAVLRALIQFPDGLRREQLTVLTGYKRSTRDAYIQRLKEKGFVDINLVYVFATDAGRGAIPDAEPLPTGEALQQWWLPRLPVGERAIMEQLIALYPDAGQRDDLTERTGYQRSTRDAYLQRLGAKQLVVDLGRGSVKASDTLFEVGA